MNIILLGAPGAGKGTQAQRIQDKRGFPQISTGDMLRKALREGTELGKKAKTFMDAGDLVPDDVVVGIVRERLAEPDCAKGFILVGFPRTVPQADALAGAGVKIDFVLSYEVPEDELVKRLTGRRSCPGCGAMYHVMFHPPERDDVCDRCGAKGLIQRADDNEETVRSRLVVYGEKTQPLIDYYDERGLLQKVEAKGTPDEVLANTLAVLDR